MSGLRSGPVPDNIKDDATIGFDADGLVMSVSGHAASILGYASPEEIEGQNLFSLIGDEAAISLLDRLHEREGAADTGGESLRPHTGTVAFVRRDGTRAVFNAVVTPETSGGWITLVGSVPAGNGGGGKEGMDPPADVRAALRSLSRTAILADREEELVAHFATELRAALGSETFLVARSTGASGMYEPVAISTSSGTRAYAASIDLPRALVPAQGAGPVAIESLDSLALFEPVFIAGAEAEGALLAARVEQPGGAHLLLLAVDAEGHAWPDDSLLLVEAAALFMASTLRGFRLREGMGTATRSQETLRQIGVLAGGERDEDFLGQITRLLARRLPLAGLSVHGIDPVTSRCFVAATSGHEDNPLTPSYEWPLAGSLEQHVLRTNAPVLVSAAVADRVTVQPEAVEHWRRSGLQAVISVPLRINGQTAATLTAGFTSPPQPASDAVRLIETIAPAVQVGAGLAGGKQGASGRSDPREADPGYVKPELLLGLTRAASESPDTETLFASVTEWLLEIIPSARVAWGVIDRNARTYRRTFTYDAASASLPGEEVTRLEREDVEDMKSPGLKLPEPGQAAPSVDSMRAAVITGQRVGGVVTVWPQDGETFTQADLARLQRVCEYITGPLARILDTQTVRDAQQMFEDVSQVGAQVAGFHDPAYALRSVRPSLVRILPHDRLMLLEFDQAAGTARVLFDSAAVPQAMVAELLLSALPGAVVTAESPAAVSTQSHTSPRPDSGVFREAGALLTVPLKSSDGASGALVLASNTADAYAEAQVELAKALSTHLTSAFASWQAHQSNREWTRELREARKQLNSILSSAPVALINMDAQGVCTGLQGQGLETLGIRREELFGRSIFELTGKLPQIEDAIRQALRGIPAMAVASLGLHAAEVWAQPVMEVDGTVSGVTLVGYDVSERIRNRRARADIRELQAVIRERTRFVSAVSHELRNPLTSIVAFTDILSANQTDNLTPQQAHALTVIQKASERLDALIGDLLDLSRMDAGDFGLDVTEVDVNDFLEEIIDAQQPIFTGAGQVLALNGPEVAYTIQADQLRLTQVISNLLSNASKYSPPGTTVTVEASVHGARLNIAVEDNGPGIPESQVERVFDAFYRVDNEATRSVPGTGLGLAIARRITEMHGGQISLQSAPGEGTRVTVSLPSVKAKGDEVTPPMATVTQASGRPKRRRQSS